MPLKYIPDQGEIVICDFTRFGAPEITKIRPAIVISSMKKNVAKVCTVVALSTTEPRPVLSHHAVIKIDPPLRKPYDSPEVWVKGDMIYTLSISRLNRPSYRDSNGVKHFYQQIIGLKEFEKVEWCVRNWLNLF
ncbi:MAG TPA: type II toxin-antitoxin system PemK/MazF family toxin [Anaerolineaceae bacterium]|jgi:mRNA interferase MazF|nr:type II toxin-antitoxin system PemK/MazF family toxin [Anaerolineaceae bacterium]